MEKIIITSEEKGISMQVEGNPNITILLNMLLTVAGGAMKQAIGAAPKEVKKQLSEMLYDSFNEAASVVLTDLIPDKDMRPDLTNEAILRAQDEIMKEHIKKYDN